MAEVDLEKLLYEFFYNSDSENDFEGFTQAEIDGEVMVDDGDKSQ